MKAYRALLIVVLMAGCAQIPMIDQRSPRYPAYARGSDYWDAVEFKRGSPEFKSLVGTAIAIDHRENVSQEQIDQLREARQEYLIAKKQSDDAKAAEARRREAEIQAANRRTDYLRDFAAIDSPENAASFYAKYASYDPDGLRVQAEKVGYERGIARQKSCIEYANKTIAQQKEIGNTVGYVDKSALYSAGVMLVDCRKRLKQYTEELARRKK